MFSSTILSNMWVVTKTSRTTDFDLRFSNNPKINDVCESFGVYINLELDMLDSSWCKYHVSSYMLYSFLYLRSILTLVLMIGTDENKSCLYQSWTVDKSCGDKCCFPFCGLNLWSSIHCCKRTGVNIVRRCVGWKSGEHCHYFKHSRQSKR